MTKFVAGFNLSSYLPEVEPELFDTEEEARDYIREELDNHIFGDTLDVNDEDIPEGYFEPLGDWIEGEPFVYFRDLSGNLWSYWVDIAED